VSVISTKFTVKVGKILMLNTVFSVEPALISFHSSHPFLVLWQFGGSTVPTKYETSQAMDL